MQLINLEDVTKDTRPDYKQTLPVKCATQALELGL